MMAVRARMLAGQAKMLTKKIKTKIHYKENIIFQTFSIVLKNMKNFISLSLLLRNKTGINP